MGLLGHLHQPGGLLLGAAAEACELVTGRQQLWRLVAAHACISGMAKAAPAAAPDPEGCGPGGC